MPLDNALNFSGGPGVLPATVLDEVQQAIRAVPEEGLSVLGISHRSDWFAAVVDEAERNIRHLLGLPDDFAVLFLQGGATLQFSMIPMLMLRGSGKTAEYLHSGYWSGKSVAEAEREGPVRVLWSGRDTGFSRLPEAAELAPSPAAAYFHYVSNETVEGLQFHEMPGLDEVPRVCDMSSDFLSRPVDCTRYDLIYAHAQKNLGPAGVTVVLIRRAWLERQPQPVPSMLDYRKHWQAHSIYNTPPVFAIYVVMLVTRWLRDEIDGLAQMAARNERKAALLYDLLDESPEFFRGHAAEVNRSRMNVAFRLPTDALEQVFLREARVAGFSGLEGHRSLGGLRASIYNAMTLPAVAQLAAFMTDFRTRAG